LRIRGVWCAACLAFCVLQNTADLAGEPLGLWRAVGACGVLQINCAGRPLAAPFSPLTIAHMPPDPQNFR
jgi:hypothetical protein